MTIFTVNSQNQLIEAPRVLLEREIQLEEWLHNSPWAVANEDLLIIGRQTKASIAENNRYPDLLALDKDGNIVVIELKKGKAPREVIAQILEYAAWASQLSADQIKEIANINLNSDVYAIFKEYFEVDEVPMLGSSLRLFIAAEEIPPTLSEVCRFLRQNLGLDISCVIYEAHRGESGSLLVDSSLVVGGERLAGKSSNINPTSNANNWNGDTPVKEIIWNAVRHLSHNNHDFVFSPKDIISYLSTAYPDVNKSTIRCQIASDCVNHPSRHHWPGGIDRYWQIQKGKYRLYNQLDDQWSIPIKVTN
ncbi:hypothetical protein LG200_05645 [Methylobacillus caricis]|uniref:DUF7669 domain-containing protein n=1 Tax=Methylobacillus caricis TaxID=1971611 RepID=UPI001CFF6F82|nr:hypothetical protein [Methylobacillus caricis]MCB5187489.1 hypothetical protein [Methylobacillus caricis]